MFCSNCGAQNEENAKFCAKCGTKLKEIEPGAGTVTVHQEPPVSKKKKKGMAALAAGAAVVILAALCVAGFFAFQKVREKQQYTKALDRGQKYLEEMDYEKAETEFLAAIEIDPKEPEPYLSLADLYLADDKPEKAVEILKNAKKSVSKENAKKKTDKGDSGADIEDKLGEIESLESYQWVVEPEKEADDISYCEATSSDTDSLNDMERQQMDRYAVIEKDGKYGLIDQDGNMAVEMDYTGINRFSDFYILTAPEKRFEPEVGYETSQYMFYKGEISPALGLGDGGSYNYYYYYEGIHNWVDQQGDTSYVYRYSREPKNPVPVQQGEKVYTEFSQAYYERMENEKFALYADGGLKTDFEYEDMGSWLDGLAAVSKDGKWGYINREGQEVIPVEYDATWSVTDYSYSLGESVEKDMAYAASEGYAPLCKDGIWEMRNTEGKVVIAPGVFEKILPVYNGKCWVMRDGKWGVIELGSTRNDTEKTESSNLSQTVSPEEYQNLYGALIDKVSREYDTYCSYAVYDIDKDGVKELLLEKGTCEADYMFEIYTITNGAAKKMGECSGSHMAGFYEDEKGGKEPYLVQSQCHMGYEIISHISIENGAVKVEEISSREVAPDEAYYTNEYPVEIMRVNDKSLLEKAIAGEDTNE